MIYILYLCDLHILTRLTDNKYHDFILKTLSSQLTETLSQPEQNNEIDQVKWLAVKTASEMTYTVSGGALNSTQSNPR